ncbi:DM13 domain-containing protein [Salinirubellus salinus]|uniref:DM13 domain-containing protein n=1 Tax=Salinirubellus salinus TaxID=1364945 RepID=A0A9E7R639_9EURY|nr:DM13 domain-containing protein [Salinirubellus salinus]UWM56601.1 DM13 domain-containing protein [Salinirubellus salinus]
MQNRTVVALGVAALSVVGGVFVFDVFFAAEASTQAVDTPLPEGAVVLSEGRFEGKAGHDVSGRVQLVELDGEHYLRFVDYDQEQGPDVFVYLTPAEDPDTGAEIAAGRRILVDGGADGGESTVEGTFLQRIPGDVDPADYRGVGVWCDRFRTPFGAATLR